MLKFASIPGVSALSQGALRAVPTIASTGCVPLWQLFQPGQLIELSGEMPGKSSVVTQLVARAQAEQEPVAWIALRSAASLYPPDMARAGVDLAALVVVRLEESAGQHGLLRAAEVLLRSGAFGLVVVDLLDGTPPGELAWQARLSGLLRRHAARGVVLTQSARENPSLGPLVSLRIEPHVRTAGEGRVVLEQRLLKNKLGEQVRISPDTRCLPAGA